MTDRQRLLTRLERLRAAERGDALAALAARRAHQQRMDEVAQRSRALAANGAGFGTAADGAAVCSALAFTARIAALAGQAERLADDARAAEAAARARFAEADQRLERVRDQHRQARRATADRELARSLLNGLHQPRGPF